MIVSPLYWLVVLMKPWLMPPGDINSWTKTVRQNDLGRLRGEEKTVFGRFLETFIYQELRRHTTWYDEPITFSHFRNKDKVEIDIVLESKGLAAGVEAKAAITMILTDYKSFSNFFRKVYSWSSIV